MFRPNKEPTISKHPYAWVNIPSNITALFAERIDPNIKFHYMKQAIAEAWRSSLRPTVGAVIVRNDEIIARGHRHVKALAQYPPRWRVIHAEQAALEDADEPLSGATLYVTLEPCAERYHGPAIEDAEVCSALIAASGLSAVVIGLVDRDPMTFGDGLRHLKAAGIQLEHAYQGLETDLYELIGNGQFGVLRPTFKSVLRKIRRTWG